MYFGAYHALVRVGRAAGHVQQLAVLQLLAEPLQRVDRLVELHGHRHLGQVLADVVAQDVPHAHTAAAGAGRWQRRAPPHPSPRGTRGVVVDVVVVPTDPQV